MSWAINITTEQLSERRHSNDGKNSHQPLNSFRLLYGAGRLDGAGVYFRTEPGRNGSIDPRFAITEVKRYLGKQLFFDPVRSNRIKPEFGGLPSTAQTGSCGSCHLGEVAGKAGQVINLHLGGEGRGFTDAFGGFHVRRRLQPGLVDVIPTGVQQIVNGVILKDGRFDAVDSVPRLSPSMIGFGFNTRLLLGGKAGQPAGDPNNLLGLPAGENLALIAFDAHRMLETQKNALQQSPVYVSNSRFSEFAGLSNHSVRR